ncbi:MAG: hypothetical protein IJ364_01140 [Oscillospiraceae bacterium]|nr:hypothetical protein [Oscillospiraceae bacterium]
MEFLKTLLTSAAGAAIFAGIFSLIQYRMKRKDEQSDSKNAERKALRYMMLYIIEERCKEFIADGEISLEDLRRLHHWHELYHDGLGGNGDADKLLKRVESLKIITD